MEEQKNVSCKNLSWINITHENKNYSKILEESFNMYKNRPLDTPIKTKEVLFDYYPCNVIILCDNDDKVYGGIMWWVTEYGNKLSTSFSLNSEIYKKYIINKYVELLKMNGYYAELSDALEYLVRKGPNNLKNITDISTIKTVVNVLEDDIFIKEDDSRRNEYLIGKNPSPIGSYIRVIEGIGKHRKALYGNPCMTKTYEGEGCNRKCIVEGKENLLNNMNGGKYKTKIKYKTKRKYKTKNLCS